MMQNQIAWSIATKEGIAERDLALAEKIARRANDASKDNNAEVLDTLARVLFLKGEKQAAIRFQEKAVDLAEGGRKRQFQRSLDDYKAGKVPNEAAASQMQRKISDSIQRKEWDKAESAVAELEKFLADQKEDPAMVQNEFAWRIVIMDGVDARGLDLAERIARRANDATKGRNAEILDTLARVLFLKGQKQQAIELQDGAVKYASGRRKEQFQGTLDSYKSGQLPKPY